MTRANPRITLLLATIMMLGAVGLSESVRAETTEGFSQAELDQMLAPIALYPDSVLSHVLIAATYPLEVVQAARWSRANSGYAGEHAVQAVESMPWDPSVMALVAFPELLERLDADLLWTQRLGDAFLIQEYQVLDTIQYLREEAYASGHLRSNEYVRVVRETRYIYIEPTVTRLVHVPWYDPYTVYGNWRFTAYPPVYWAEPRGYRSGFSFYWGSGHRLQYGFFFSAFHWPSHRLVVHDYYNNRYDNSYNYRHHGYSQGHGSQRYGKHGYAGPRFASARELARHENARHWKHDPDHRRGVAYRRGIDERHTIRRASTAQAASGTPAGNAVHSPRRSHSSGDFLGNNPRIRRDLLRQRSRNSELTAQRSSPRHTASNSRNRDTSARRRQSQNSNRGAVNTSPQVDDRPPTAATPPSRNRSASRSTRPGISQSSSPRSGTRRATPDRSSSSYQPLQDRASGGRTASRMRSGEGRSDRARRAQLQTSTRQSSSTAALRSSPGREIKPQSPRQSQSRPKSGSSRAPGNRPAASRQASRYTTRSRQTNPVSRSPRAETLRSRVRDRKQ